MITVTPKEEDILAYIRLRRRWLFTSRTAIFITWLPMAIVVLFALWLIIFGQHYGAPSEYGYWILGLFAWIWLLLGINYVLAAKVARRIFKRHKFAERPYTLEWNGEKLLKEEAISKSAIPWADFTKWAEDKRIFMLYLHGAPVVFVPKRIFSETTLQDFRHLLQTKIGPRGVKRKLEN